MSEQTLKILILLRLCNSLSSVHLSSETHNRLLHRKVDKSTVTILHPQAIMFLAQDIIRYIKLEICYKGPHKTNGLRYITMLNVKDMVRYFILKNVMILHAPVMLRYSVLHKCYNSLCSRA